MRSQHTGSLTAQEEEEAYRNTHWIRRSLERLWACLDHNRGGYSSSSSTGCSDVGNPLADASSHNALENSFSEMNTGSQGNFSAGDFPSLRDPFDSF